MSLSYIAAPRSFVGWHGKSLKLTKSRKISHHPGCIAISLLFNHCSMWQKFNFEKKKYSKTKTCKRQKNYPKQCIPFTNEHLSIIVQCAWNDKKLPNSWMETIPDTFSSEWVCKSPFICPFMTAEPDLKAEITR